MYERSDPVLSPAASRDLPELSYRLAGIAAISASFIWLYWAVIPDLVLQWWNEPEYSHGFLVPAISAGLIWMKKDALRTIAMRPGYWGLPVMVAAVMFYVAGSVGADLFLQRISLVLTLCGATLFVCGWPLTKSILFPLAFLLFMVPLPGIIFNSIAFPLQLLAAQVATSVMQVCAVPVFREGNVMHLASAALDVEEACSGIRSLLSLTTLAVLYTYLSYSAWVPRVLIMLAVVPIAIIANVFRVTVTGLMAHYLSVETALGVFHTIGGLSVFLVAAAMLMGLGKLLQMTGLAK